MKRHLALVGLALSLAACGTTVPLTSQATVNGATSGDGLAAGSTGGTTTGSATTGSTVLDGGSATSGSPGSTSTTGTSGTGTSGTTGASSGALGAGGTSSTGGLVTYGRGITAKTVTIGFALPTGGEAVASAFGISGAGSVSPQNMVAAAVDDINKHGGVLGRKLVVYIHNYDATALISNPAAVYAQICSDFRDDHKVFAVAFTAAPPAIRACTQAMGSPLIMAGGISSLEPTSAYQEKGGSWVYGLSSITTERLGALYVQSLQARSFHQKWNTTTGTAGGAQPVKLGLIHARSQEQDSLYAAEARELARFGLSFSDTVTYEQNAQAGLAATQSAVLKFRSEGITHVYGASAFFLQYAQSQGYKPRYAYIPGLGALGAANSPKSQMNGALTVGWAPYSDVDSAQAPPESAAAKKCQAIMRARGYSTANRSDQGSMVNVCDTLNGFVAALSLSRTPTVAGLRLGYEGLGKGFPTAYTFAALLGANRHYGVDSVRDMAYDNGCGCFTYTSKTDRR